MPIVDAQVHLWDKGKPNAWHRQIPVYTKDDLLKEMDEAGVDRAVIVPPMWHGDDNAQALAAAQAHPTRLAVQGRLPLLDPASAKLLPGWNRQKGMYGLRFTFATPEQRAAFLDAEALEWLWAGAEREGLPVMLMASGMLPAVERIATRHPGLKLGIDHFGAVSQQTGEAAFADLPFLLSLARFSNVAVKATSLPCYSAGAYPWRDAHDNFRRIYDAFGPRRMFWGTDITRLNGTYRQSVTLFTEEIGWLKGHDLDLVMGRALCDWIGWPA